MRHITRCTNTKLTEICLQAIKLEEISAITIGYLPESLRAHCKVGSFRNGCLVLTTQDPVWAAQLRYFIPELRDKLRSEAKIYQLGSIKVTIDVEHNQVQTKKAVIKVIQTSPWGKILDYLKKEPS